MANKTALLRVGMSRRRPRTDDVEGFPPWCMPGYEDPGSAPIGSGTSQLLAFLIDEKSFARSGTQDARLDRLNCRALTSTNVDSWAVLDSRMFRVYGLSVPLSAPTSQVPDLLRIFDWPAATTPDDTVRATAGLESPRRLFTPSKNLVQLVVRKQSPFSVNARALAVGESKLEFSEADAEHHVRRAIEGAISTWANDSAEDARAVIKPLSRNGRFDEKFAEWLARRLNVGVMNATEVLGVVAAELTQFLSSGPIARSWGRLRLVERDIQAVLAPAPRRMAANPRVKALLIDA